MFDLPTMFARLLVWMIAAPVHEFAHAFAAYQLGDNTAEREGRLTLNPAVHIDPVGLLLVVMFGFGWARPVPYNPAYLRYGPRLGSLIVAIAGPLSNLLLAVLFVIPVRLGLIDISATAMGSIGMLPNLSMFWQEAIYLNLLLLVFNLLPIAPLDGFKVMWGILPVELAAGFLRTEQAGSMILFLMMMSGYVLNFSILGELIGLPLSMFYFLLVGVF